MSCSWKSVFCRFLDCHFQSFNFGFLSLPYRNILFFFQILKPVLIWRTVTVLFVCLFWWVLATWFIWNDPGLASFAPCPACGFSFSLRKRLLYNLSLFLLTRTRNWFSLAWVIRFGALIKPLKLTILAKVVETLPYLFPCR